MKRTVNIIILSILILLLSGCAKSNDEIYVGVNAEILEISKELNVFIVKDLNSDNILGEKCIINCESPKNYFLHVNYKTHKITDLEFKDFAVGDHIAVNIRKVENKYALPEGVQLTTQRL